MNELVVLSGKGGTGKTSITAALAILAGDNAIIADCDVDAANMHLLLKPNFKQATEFFSGELAVIDPEICISCGKCAEVCRFNAVSVKNNIFSIKTLDCEGCGYCEKVCPANAIKMNDRKSGMVYVSTIKNNGTLVHAKLDIAAENSGKLVAKVKTEAKRIAEEQSKSLIIVDGSPGTGCPVVSSLAGATFVLLVTEPTSSGLHDLQRVYEVIKRFRIPAGCIINKYDLNTDKTKELKTFLIQQEIIHIADIPFNSQFIELMVDGKTLVEEEGFLKMEMEKIWILIQDSMNLKL